jgi:hypothetical protein
MVKDKKSHLNSNPTHTQHHLINDRTNAIQSNSSSSHLQLASAELSSVGINSSLHSYTNLNSLSPRGTSQSTPLLREPETSNSLLEEFKDWDFFRSTMNSTVSDSDSGSSGAPQLDLALEPSHISNDSKKSSLPSSKATATPTASPTLNTNAYTKMNVNRKLPSGSLPRKSNQPPLPPTPSSSSEAFHRMNRNQSPQNSSRGTAVRNSQSSTAHAIRPQSQQIQKASPSRIATSSPQLPLKDHTSLNYNLQNYYASDLKDPNDDNNDDDTDDVLEQEDQQQRSYISGQLQKQHQSNQRRKRILWISLLSLLFATLASVGIYFLVKYIQRQNKSSTPSITKFTLPPPPLPPTGFVPNNATGYSGRRITFEANRNIGRYVLAKGDGGSSGVAGIHVGLMVGTGKVVLIER